MLEKPDIQDEQISAGLWANYGLRIAQIAFLPLGADPHTAVYRTVASDTTTHFVKLRSGAFDETSVELPRFLSDQGIAQIIAPLRSRAGRLWARLGDFTVIVYPFVEGRDGYEQPLSASQWQAFGAAFRRIHTLAAPSGLAARIRRETYGAQARQRVGGFLASIEHARYTDPIAAELAAFLNAQRAIVDDLIARAERYAQMLQARALAFVVCHSDIHPGNLLLGSDGALYIVDWDDPIYAPKERDLMFIGGGQGFAGVTAAEEWALFYQGYGEAQVDHLALAYYRYERIILDIAVYCKQLLLSTEGGEDRPQALHYLKGNFLPNGTIAVAAQADSMR